MKYKMIVNYVSICILIIGLIFSWIYFDGNKYNNKTLQSELEELRRENLKLNTDLIVKNNPNLVENDNGEMVSKDDRILELESKVIVKEAIILDQYEFIEALGFYKDILQQIMDYNEISYPEFIYQVLGEEKKN